MEIKHEKHQDKVRAVIMLAVLQMSVWGGKLCGGEAQTISDAFCFHA